ncbi:hypothetical protein QEN19_001647 [Hanseniaspora menglaensis]
MSFYCSENKISKNKKPYRNHPVLLAENSGKLASVFNALRGTVTEKVKTLLPTKYLKKEKIETKNTSIDSMEDELTETRANEKIYSLITKFLEEKGDETLSNTECDIIKTLLDHSSAAQQKNTDIKSKFILNDKESGEVVKDKKLGPKLAENILSSISYQPLYEKTYKDDETEDLAQLSILTLKSGRRVFSFTNDKSDSKIVLAKLQRKTSEISDNAMDSNNKILSGNEQLPQKYNTEAAKFLVSIIKENNEQENELQTNTKSAIDYSTLMNPYNNKQTAGKLIDGFNIVKKDDPTTTKSELYHNVSAEEAVDDNDEILILDDDILESENESEKFSISAQNSSDLEEIIYDADVDNYKDISSDEVSSDDVKMIGSDDDDDDDDHQNISNSDLAEHEEKELLEEEEQFIVNEFECSSNKLPVVDSKKQLDTYGKYKFPEPTFLGLSNDKSLVNEAKVNEYLNIYTF